MASSGAMGMEDRRPRGAGSRGGHSTARTKPGSKVDSQRRNSQPERMSKKLDEGFNREDLPDRGFVRLGRTQTDILIGVEDISTWDNEEIRRGRKRDINGGWRGREPSVVAMALHQEAIKRTFEEAQEIMREGLVPAVKYLAAIVEDDDVEPKDRLKAVAMIMDRVLGKTPDRVEIKTGTEPWEDALVSAVVPLEVNEVTPEEEDDDASIDQGS